jgi:hypothetical protein
MKSENRRAGKRNLQPLGVVRRLTPPRSADGQSAVSQVGNLRGLASVWRVRRLPIGGSAVTSNRFRQKDLKTEKWIYGRPATRFPMLLFFCL